jgi:hypothetical protein
MEKFPTVAPSRADSDGYFYRLNLESRTPEIPQSGEQMAQPYAIADLRQPWCGLGIWGLRTGTRYGAGWIVLFTLCLLGGIVTLAKAVGFI